MPQRARRGYRFDTAPWVNGIRELRSRPRRGAQLSSPARKSHRPRSRATVREGPGGCLEHPRKARRPRRKSPVTPHQAGPAIRDAGVPSGSRPGRTANRPHPRRTGEGMVCPGYGCSPRPPRSPRSAIPCDPRALRGPGCSPRSPRTRVTRRAVRAGEVRMVCPGYGRSSATFAFYADLAVLRALRG